MCKTTFKHVTGRQLAALLTKHLCSILKVEPEDVVGFGRDSASINSKACRLLTTNPFINAQQILCMSHTLNNAGAAASFDTLDSWFTPLA